ncbi:unnamed protein product [Phytomonas sp. EM1]|nr:unnamed protein product [Phytomonas sp. EM1]|eukprot:CCW59928.1 unnamed protein product [Phytomonas sp. isolate EM1]
MGPGDCVSGPLETQCDLNFRALLQDPNLSPFMHAVTRNILDLPESASLMSRLKPLDAALVYRAALWVPPSTSKSVAKPFTNVTKRLDEENAAEEICRDILNSLNLQGRGRELLEECKSCGDDLNDCLRFTKLPSLSRIQKIEENYPNYAFYLDRRETQLQLEILSCLTE